MDKLHHALTYALAHWTMIASYLAAALSLLGTLRAIVERLKGKTATEADHALGYLCDVLSFVARNGQRGLVGALSLPLFPSMPLVQKPPTAPARGIVRGDILLALACAGLFVLAVMAGGCGTAGGQALGKCELGAMPQQTEAVIAAVSAVLANTGDINWVGDLEALGVQAGPSLVDCAVAAITAAAQARMPAHGQPEPMLLTVIQRGQIWGKAHPAKCCAAGK